MLSILGDDTGPAVGSAEAGYAMESTASSTVSKASFDLSRDEARGA